MVLKMVEEFKKIVLTKVSNMKVSIRMINLKEMVILRQKIETVRDTNTKDSSKMEHQIHNCFLTNLEFEFQVTKNRNRI